jgi:hypothetical protein
MKLRVTIDVVTPPESPEKYERFVEVYQQVVEREDGDGLVQEVAGVVNSLLQCEPVS